MPRRSRGDSIPTSASGSGCTHFSEEELVELACFISLTMGQQSWIRLLNIDHHEVMAGSTASMAPGFESKEALATSKQSVDYWGAAAKK